MLRPLILLNPFQCGIIFIVGCRPERQYWLIVAIFAFAMRWLFISSPKLRKSFHIHTVWQIHVHLAYTDITWHPLVLCFPQNHFPVENKMFQDSFSVLRVCLFVSLKEQPCIVNSFPAFLSTMTSFFISLSRMSFRLIAILGLLIYWVANFLFPSQ